MHVYRTQDVTRLAGIKPATLRSLIRAGHVKPAKGRGGRHEFSFQDLIVLRMAQGLSTARLPTRRIVKCIRQLRRELPASIPLSGLSVTAVGDSVAVREGVRQRELESGQYLLSFGVEMNDSGLRITEEAQSVTSADGSAHYEEGCAFEDEEDLVAALAAYQRCVAANQGHVEARINCGRLLHQAGRLQEAERMYREAKRADGTLLFNLAVLLEDLERDAEAAVVYREALDADPELADAHYNLARLHERAGNARDCIRHLMAYRRAMR